MKKSLALCLCALCCALLLGVSAHAESLPTGWCGENAS